MEYRSNGPVAAEPPCTRLILGLHSGWPGRPPGARQLIGHSQFEQAAALHVVRKLSHEHSADVDDMRSVPVFHAGKLRTHSPSEFAFNTMSRLADAFGLFLPGPKAFEAGAKYLLARGYR